MTIGGLHTAAERGTARSTGTEYFCLRYQQLLFWHIYFVLVCLLLFVYCLFIIVLGHAKSSIFRVQSAVRGHGTARAHYTPPTTHGGTGTRPHTGTRGIGGVTKHKLLILAKTPNGTLPIRTIETKRLSLKREPN